MPGGFGAVGRVGELGPRRHRGGPTGPAPLRPLLATNRLNLPGWSGYGFSSGTDTDSNSRIATNNQSGAGLKTVRLVWVNWAAGVNEIAGLNPITVTASVEYPAGTFTRVTFAGQAAGVIAADGHLVSDDITLATTIPVGAKFWTRTHVSVASGQKWPLQYTIRSAGWTDRQEAADFGTGVDRTMGGTITDATPTATRRGFGPVAILGTAFDGTPVSRAFASIGDSLLMEAGDGAVDASGSGGWNGRALTGRYPHVNFAISGTQAASNLAANFVRRRAVLAVCGVTDVLCSYANNDIAAGRTLAQLQGYLADIWGWLAADGYRVHQTTSPPRTTGTFLTAAGQTLSTAGGAYVGGTASLRHAFNAWVRSVPAPLAGCVDISTAVDVDGGNVRVDGGGLWISGNGGAGTTDPSLTTTGAATDKATNDGVHPNVTGTDTGGHFIMRDTLIAYLAGMSG